MSAQEITKALDALAERINTGHISIIPAVGVPTNA